MAKGETKVFEVYDRETGKSFGVCPNRSQAYKHRDELGLGMDNLSVRAIWVDTIFTNTPEDFARCETR